MKKREAKKKAAEIVRNWIALIFDGKYPELLTPIRARYDDADHYRIMQAILDIQLELARRAERGK